jgi:hypothetical protein
MKTLIKVLALVGVSIISVPAQTNKNDIANNHPSITRPKPDVYLIEPQKAPNRIVRKKVAYSGVIIQAAKTDNPFQLINPFAPAHHGDGYANVSYDAGTGKPRGLKLLSLEF